LRCTPSPKSFACNCGKNTVLKSLGLAQWNEFEPLLEITDYAKGDTLELQGTHAMEQYFVIDGTFETDVPMRRERK